MFRTAVLHPLREAPQGRTGTFDEPVPAWWSALETILPFVLLALLVALVTRAILRRHRYRAVGVLDDAAQAAVRAALTEAERRTTGEIIATVVERSDRHPAGCWLAAVVTLLAGTALLEGWLPWSHPVWLLCCQIGLGALGYLLAASLPDVQRLFVSDARATEVADEQAFQEFFRQGLHKTSGATGVLIFTSLFERRVVVLADEGIAKNLPDDFWQEVDDAILAGIRDGSLREGLIAGIGKAGEALAEHAPWQAGDRDELPDHLVVRRE